MPEAQDRILESYGSSRVKESRDGWQQRRALDQESEWFVEARELLGQLDEVGGGSYPALPSVIELLERKQVEQSLVEAWTFWHDGAGDPLEAARSLSAFLCAPGAPALFDPDEAGDRVVRYAQVLLRVLLDSETAVPLFGEQRPLPGYLSGTLLGQTLSIYERSRAGRTRAPHEGTEEL